MRFRYEYIDEFGFAGSDERTEEEIYKTHVRGKKP